MSRPLAAGLAIAMVALLTGDGGRASGTVQGIDPLDILNLQVKPNILFVVDTSQAMGFTGDGTLYVGGDDVESRLYQTKQALRELIAANDGKANFGIVDLNANQNELALSRSAPMVYVSTDPTGTGAASWAGRFDRFAPALPVTGYDGDACVSLPTVDPFCSDEIHASLANNGAFASPLNGRFYMLSRLLRNNVKYVWDPTAIGNFERRMVAVDTAITCPPPPAGLLSDDSDQFNGDPVNEPRACFQIEDADTNEITTYYLTSSTFGPGSAFTPECDGTVPRCLVTPVPACTDGSNLAAILGGPLRLQLPLDATLGLPTGVPVTPVIAGAALVDTQPNANGGLQIGNLRPLDAALRASGSHYSGTVFPSRPAAVAGRQRNFIIVIASGGDNAAGNPALTAAGLRGAGVIPGANDITTMVVAFNGAPGFPGSADQAQLNAIQAAGTLSRYTTAFGATTDGDLRSSLNLAFSEAIAAGTFSTDSSITESIFEYAPQANTTVSPIKTFNPLDPASRYNARVPTLLQSSFDMPGFRGHLRAFQSPGASGCPVGAILRSDANGNPTCELWDAGRKLRDRVWEGTGANGMCPGNAASDNFTACSAQRYTFDDLRGGDPGTGSITSAAPTYSPSGRIRRRIFTTGRRGVFAYQSNLGEPFGPAQSPSDAQCPVPLWPPTSSASVGGCTNVGPVAPRYTDPSNPPGILDEELGIATLTFAQLQSRYAACLGTAPGHPCLDANPAVALARARREARETILAFTAGAQQADTTGGIPFRPNPASPGLDGEIRYHARSWVMAESTLGVPAVVPPPLEAPPITHTAEYVLFRDGIRDSTGAAPSGLNPAASGFGLRNPDRNAGPGIGAPAGANGNFEPLMTTIYHAANDMIHAFRGGPCPSGACRDGVAERGGEELWGFVPNDQLDKLADRMQGQGRSPHTYMVASSIRFSDVFVPGSWQESVTGRTFLGRWRTIMMVGRGIAGKHYTALDITSPGQFSNSALNTIPPFAIWSRGNPDTYDGTPTGTANSSDDPTGDDGANDAAAYARMGETWSVPAIAAVDPDEFFDSQYVAFTGSGYSTGDPAEGKTFYAMDALTGDVLFDPQAPDSSNGCTTLDAGETCPVPNAIVANAAAYIPVQLKAGFVGNPGASTAAMVYVGDLHGRMWKFVTSNTGLGLVKIQPDLAADSTFGDSPDQPIGSAVALLNIDNVPHVYWGTGNDLRVIPPAPFKFTAMMDQGADQVIEPATGLFVERLESNLLGFRGTAQPATAFNATGLGRVFFIGTKFTDANVAGGDCQSRFDSVLFAVGAVSGAAVYDLDSSGSIAAGEKSFMVSGKVNAIRGSIGQIVLDKGEVDPLGAGGAPPAPPAPAPAPTANLGSSGEVFVEKIKPGSNVCR